MPALSTRLARAEKVSTYVDRHIFRVEKSAKKLRRCYRWNGRSYQSLSWTNARPMHGEQQTKESVCCRWNVVDR